MHTRRNATSDLSSLFMYLTRKNLLLTAIFLLIVVMTKKNTVATSEISKDIMPQPELLPCTGLDLQDEEHFKYLEAQCDKSNYANIVVSDEKPDTGFHQCNELYLARRRKKCKKPYDDTGIGYSVDGYKNPEACLIQDFRFTRFARFKAIPNDHINAGCFGTLFIRQESLTEFQITYSRDLPLRTVHAPLAAQAAGNLFTSDRLYFDNPPRILQAYHNHRGWHTVDVIFVSEQSILINPSDGNKYSYYYLKGGHNATMIATSNDVVKPQQGCSLKNTLPLGRVSHFTIFKITQDCHNKAGEKQTKSEFKRGKFVSAPTTLHFSK